MILKVFAVRDMKALAFQAPFFSLAPGSALRAFGDECEKEGTPFHKHPEDYVLYEVGVYDDSTALLESLNPVRMMGCASDFVTVNAVPKERS